MKKGLTELVFILDKSGSMYELTSDTIGGFNSTIEQQKKEEGEAFVTTVLFDSDYTVLHDHINLKDIPVMTDKEYVTGGTTALLDAVGFTIDNIGKRLADTPEDERPENVIITIITDGFENASKEYSRSVVKEKIQHQQDKYSWKFVFLGANMDAVEEASTLGIKKSFSKTYTNSKRGLETAYLGMSMVMSATRKRSTFDTEEEYEEAVLDSLDGIE